jgi:hypothetical protein
VRRCDKLRTQAQIFEGDAPHILTAFYRFRKSDSDWVDAMSHHYQNSEFAFAGKLVFAIASNCCHRNQNQSIDSHLAVLGV